jgi:hypothetical protein
LEEADPPPLVPPAVRKVENTFPAFAPQDGQGMLFTVLLQSSSVFFRQSEHKNS